MITRWSESDRVDENRNSILHAIKNGVIGLRKCNSYLAIPLVDKAFSLQYMSTIYLIAIILILSFFLLSTVDDDFPSYLFNLLPHSNHPNQQVYQKYHHPFPILTIQAFLLHPYLPYQAYHHPYHPWQPLHSFDS